MTDDDEGGTQPPRSGWAEIHRIWAAVLRSVTDRIDDPFTLKILAVLGLSCLAFLFASSDWAVVFLATLAIGAISFRDFVKEAAQLKHAEKEPGQIVDEGRRELADAEEIVVHPAKRELDSVREQNNITPDTGR